MSTLTKEIAAKIIQSRKLVATPGSHELQVNNEPFLYKGKFIVNYKAMTPYHEAEAKRLAKEGDFAAVVNQNISSSQRPTDYIPKKNEFVKVQMDYVTTKSGEQALLVVAVSPTTIQVTHKVSNIFDEDDDLTSATEVTAKIAASADVLEETV